MFSPLPPELLLPAVVIVAALLLRLGTLLKRDLRHAPPPVPARSVSAGQGVLRRIFPSRIEQLAHETTLTRATTELVASKSDELEARTALLRAAAALAAQNAEAQPAAAGPPSPPPAPAPWTELSLDDIAQVLELTSLSPQQRAALLALLSAQLGE